jgi:hypothetical protein
MADLQHYRTRPTTYQAWWRQVAGNKGITASIVKTSHLAGEDRAMIKNVADESQSASCDMDKPTTSVIMSSNCKCHPIADNQHSGSADWSSGCDTLLHAAGEDGQAGRAMKEQQIQESAAADYAMSSFRADKRSAEPCCECGVLTVNVVRSASGIQSVCERCVSIND